MMDNYNDELKNLCEIIMGQSPDSSTYNSDGIGLPFFQGKTEFGDKYPTAVKWCTKPKKMAKAGDILMSVRAPVGSTNIANADCCIGRGLAAIRVNPEKLDRDFLLFQLKYLEGYLIKKGSGSTFEAIGNDILNNLEIIVPDLKEQKIISKKLELQFNEVEKAKRAIQCQTQDLNNLENAIIYDSISSGATKMLPLAGVLIEVKKGIGENWQKYPVYGATRNGLALAKEPPGKFPQRYKPVIPGTVFYNPMRILIGSIAFAEDDQADGITSPDYVVLKGKESVVDSRWFYYWLRSPLGKQCINSLARGAVRERMLFNRLAEGKIDLPDYEVQLKASAAFASIKSMKANVKLQMEEINTIPERLLLKAFEKNINV